MSEPNAYRCGLVGLIGRANVGKSTLLNRLIGQKLSITSRKPQTTRHRIVGISTTPRAQTVFVDTPGLHRRGGRALNRYMNRTAGRVVHDVDAAVLVTVAGRWTEEDSDAWRLIRDSGAAGVVALNKIDRLRSRVELLPMIEALRGLTSCERIVPVSALRGDNLEGLRGAIIELLPPGAPIYPEEQLTDRSTRFVVSEIIREKLIEHVGQELPYRASVQIEHFEESPGRVDIGAIIWVERSSQKGIVVGHGGRLVKAVGTQARKAVEVLVGGRVNLQLWVKVKEGWSDDDRAMRALGYE